MVAGKALVALAIGLGAGVAIFAVYTFGWRDSTTDRASAPKVGGRFVRTVTDAAGTHRVYTLRYGDYVRRTEAATECGAFAEAGVPNLVCTRVGGGRGSIVFYTESVQIYGSKAEPFEPNSVLHWGPTSGIRACLPPHGPGDTSVHSRNLRVTNIGCSVGRQVALACTRFTFGHSGVCSAATDRWLCASTNPGAGSVQRCFAGPKAMTIRWNE